MFLPSYYSNEKNTTEDWYGIITFILSATTKGKVKQRERVGLGLELDDLVRHGRKGWQQEHEEVGLSASTLRKQEEMNANASICFTLNNNLGPRCMEWYHPHLGKDSALQVNCSANAVMAILSLNPIRLTVNLTMCHLPIWITALDHQRKTQAESQRRLNKYLYRPGI